MRSLHDDHDGHGSRLIANVQKAFGSKTRIWLTEYGYQTNPPDRLVGVSYATQARYEGEAARQVYEAPRVDLLIHYLVRDEPDIARWQSGLYTTADHAKPALAAFRFPLTQQSRVGRRTVLWGQVRPGGRNTYRLLRFADGAWQCVGADRSTTSHGYFTVAVNASPGARYRIWVPSEHTYSEILTVT